MLSALHPASDFACNLWLAFRNFPTRGLAKKYYEGRSDDRLMISFKGNGSIEEVKAAKIGRGLGWRMRERNAMNPAPYKELCSK